MNLPEFWFLLIGVLFTGYFVLEGFDFGVGMLMPVLGKGQDARRRVVINTIGPVWDGNEVWLITAVGAMFAAFPDWYASLFSGFYLALLLILVALIIRVCAIEYRSKINDPRWRAWCDAAIGIGSWVPALAWGWLFANVVRGVPLNEEHNMAGSVWDLLGPYALLGGLTTGSLFALHGAVFLSLKTGGTVRVDAVRATRLLLLPTAIVAVTFGIWTQLAHGTSWTWIPLACAVIGIIGAALASYRGRDGWAFTGTTVTIAAVTVLLFGSLYPNVLPSTINDAFSLTIENASSTPYTLKVMSWAALIATPVVIGYQAWTYWVFRKRITVDQIPAPIGLPLSSAKD